MINTTFRSDKTEWMDDMSIQGEELQRTLITLGHINNRLGGNRALFKGLHKLLENHDKNKPLSVLDIGCGDGDQLRRIAKWAKKHDYKMELTGLDGNPECINFARTRSLAYPEITYLVDNVFNPPKQTYHIITATLFLHHFKTNQIVEIIENYNKPGVLGFVVNDLHRSKLAYLLFWLVCIFIKNPMIKNDGLVSILRGFKRKDLTQISKILNKKTSIRWRWAFRFEWIIYN